MGGVFSFVKQTVPNNTPQNKKDFNRVVKNPKNMSYPAKMYVSYINSVMNFPAKGVLLACFTIFVSSGNVMCMKYMLAHQRKGSPIKT